MITFIKTIEIKTELVLSDELKGYINRFISAHDMYPDTIMIDVFAVKFIKNNNIIYNVPLKALAESKKYTDL